MLFETLEFLVDREVFSPVLGKVVYRFFSMSIWVLTVLMRPLRKTLKRVISEALKSL